MTSPIPQIPSVLCSRCILSENIKNDNKANFDKSCLIVVQLKAQTTEQLFPRIWLGVKLAAFAHEGAPACMHTNRWWIHPNEHHSLSDAPHVIVFPGLAASSPAGWSL